MWQEFAHLPLPLCSTVTHPNIAQFMGVSFKKGVLDPPTEAKAEGKKKKKEKKDEAGHAPVLPYADDASKDTEVCLVTAPPSTLSKGYYLHSNPLPKGGGGGGGASLSLHDTCLP